MKKIIIIILTVLLLCGCTSNKERKEKFSDVAKKYYQSYGSKLDIDEYTVTIKELKKVNKELKQNYDLELLDECSDTSKATLTIKNKKVVDVKINLSC